MWANTYSTNSKLCLPLTQTVNNITNTATQKASYWSFITNASSRSSYLVKKYWCLQHVLAWTVVPFYFIHEKSNLTRNFKLTFSCLVHNIKGMAWDLQVIKYNEQQILSQRYMYLPENVWESLNLDCSVIFGQTNETIFWRILKLLTDVLLIINQKVSQKKRDKKKKEQVRWRPGVRCTCKQTTIGILTEILYP